MELIYSRHAKERVEVYGIKDNDLKKAIGKELGSGILPGKVTFAIDETYRLKHGLPLKVIFKYIERNKVYIITAYPLKKGKKDED